METKKLYYSISEVAEMFGVNPSLIRYWEQEFSVLRPRKSQGGSRRFTERDIRYLHVIYQLVKVEGRTLEGAKKMIKEKFDKLEDRSAIIMTLNNIKSFLLDIDKQLSEKQKDNK